MKLTFNGHACVTLESSDGRTVVMDPYRSGAFGGKLSHAPLCVAADVVTVTHYHVDHSHVGPELAGPDGVLPPIIDRTGIEGLYLDAGWCYGGFKAVPASTWFRLPSEACRAFHGDGVFELVSANATHNTRRDLKFEARPVPRKDVTKRRYFGYR